MVRSKHQTVKPKHHPVDYGSGVKPLRMRVTPIVPKRKTYKFRRGTVALREIKHYQKSQKFLIPESRFQILVREIAAQFGFHTFQKNALKTLQESCEEYLVKLFHISNVCATRAKRKTLRPSDMQFAQEINKYKL